MQRRTIRRGWLLRTVNKKYSVVLARQTRGMRIFVLRNAALPSQPDESL